MTVEVENRGERDGKQVVQVYAERPDSAVDRPVRWLVGFAPVRVPAGQRAQVQVSVPTRLLAYWQDGWRYEPGALPAPGRHLRGRPATDHAGGTRVNPFRGKDHVHAHPSRARVVVISVGYRHAVVPPPSAPLAALMTEVPQMLRSPRR